MKLFEKPSTGLSDNCRELLQSCPATGTPLDTLPLIRRHWMFHNIIDHAYKLGCAKRDSEIKTIQADLEYYRAKSKALQNTMVFYRSADKLIMLALLICMIIGISSGMGTVWLLTHRNMLP